MKSTFVFLFSLLVGWSATAETVNSTLFNNGDTRYFVLSNENQIWRAQIFYQPQGQFQDLEAEKHFKSETEARQFLTNYSAPTPSRNFSGQTRTGIPIWIAAHSWNADWEKKYSEWVQANVQGDFFKKHKISTDCADVAVAVRWIFARIHGLPAGNSLAGSGQVFSSQDMQQRWLSLQTDVDWTKDQRFLAVLRYVLGNTYTHSLMRDSYPVSLSPEGLSPGTYYLYKYDITGHTQLLMNFQVAGSDKIIIAGASTVPSKIRALDVYPLTSLLDRPKKNQEAFLRTRWPLIQADQKVILQDANVSSLFSEEQFDANAGTGYRTYMDYVYNRLNGHDVQPATRVTAFIDVLKVKWQSRIDAVTTGFNYCRQNGCPLGSEVHDNYATNSRDSFIYGVVQSMTSNTMQSREAYDVYDAQRDQVIVKIDGTELSLERLVMIWMNWGFSTDPNEPVRRRWGLN